MRYDLDILFDYCRETGLRARMADDGTLEVVLGDSAVLCFQNFENEDDCQMGFLDTSWHCHGDLMFSDPRGHYVELDPLNILEGLSTGDVLVCEQLIGGSLADRWLIHKNYNDEFGHLRLGEQLVVRRAPVTVEQPTS